MTRTQSLRPTPRLLASLGGALLAACITVGSTGAVAPAVSAAPPSISDADLASAGLGLVAFDLRNAGVDLVTEPCPLLSRELLAAAMEQQGYTPNLTSYDVDAYYAEDGYPGIDCLSDIDHGPNPDPMAPHYPAVGAAYLPDGVSFEQYLTTAPQGSTSTLPQLPAATQTKT